MFIFAFNNNKNRLNMGRLVMSMVLSAFYMLATAGNPNPYFYKVTAKSGDAISTLLSRYELASQNCNVEKFYELNNMKKGSKLFAAKEYFLPIKIFRYNGKSIRSTLNIDDVNEALDIQAYNEKLLKKGLRKESFKSSRKLWVPYHKLECNGTKSMAKTFTRKENTSADKKTVNKINEKFESSGEKTITVREDFAIGKGGATRNEGKAEEAKEKSTSSKRGSGAIAVHDLFGDKYKNVNLFDDQLKGQVFYISSGHGGPDPGAQCTDLAHTLCEDEYAYDVALRLARDLTQHGATVHMIVQDENDGIRDDAFLDCDWDETCNGKDLPLRQLDRLKQRADQINKLHKKYKKRG
ncbi:MAG: N-acetylmuramoyl-L-alanine amidase [Saprospiraceae bacterium]|nr:N-acetylmuramoyl-L-alanine amidase [Saprospiraceae bacterium]